MSELEISDDLQRGIQALATVPEFTQLDLTYDVELREWLLHFAFSCAYSINSHVPRATQWYARISESYPYGSLDLYPDKEKSITCTFQHQSYNIPSEKYPWREGNICVKTPYGIWGRKEYTKEPIGDDDRLVWHIKRALDWLERASKNALVEIGDPFELPALPPGTKGRILFNETSDTFQQWQRCTAKYGTAILKNFPGKLDHYFVSKFNIDNDQCIEHSWGTHITASKTKESQAIWFMFEALPALPPWKIPYTWEDFFDLCNIQNINFEVFFKKLFRKHLPNTPRILLLGFPIPEKYGSDCSRIFWYSIHIKENPPNRGFRVNSEGYLRFAYTSLFASKTKINWMDAENWATDQITSRGKLNTTLTQSNILLIGAGAVGSLFGELLARMGCANITVLDKQIYTVGNSSRHTLTMEASQTGKAKSVADRLNSIFPFIRAVSVSDSLENQLSTNNSFLNDFDVVVDATASDDVIHYLDGLLSAEKVFLSLSTGYAAKRLFCFIKRGTSQLQNDFFDDFETILAKDNEERAEDDEPLTEGIGCWHPLFPARYDSVMMLVSAAMPKIELYIQNHRQDTSLVVIEKEYDNGQFAGLKIKESVHEI